MHPPSRSVSLPLGFSTGDRHYSDARIRALTASELLDVFASERPLSIQVAVEVLSRALEQLGPDSAVDRDALGRLAVGDFEALMLHLRRLMFGERLEAVATCASCRQTVDLAFDLTGLPWEGRAVGQSPAESERRFRLPTIADLLEIEADSDTDADIDTVTDRLWRRCVSGDDLASDDMRSDIALQMAALDPNAAIDIQSACPCCGAALTFELDAALFVLEELREHARRLLRDVHRLAAFYHWSEPEILALPVARRSAYLALIEESWEVAR